MCSASVVVAVYSGGSVTSGLPGCMCLSRCVLVTVVKGFSQLDSQSVSDVLNLAVLQFISQEQLGK